MKRVLVTGAAGFSGAVLTTALLDHGHQVIAIGGRRGPGRLSDLAPRRPGLTVLCGDLADEAFLLPHDVDVLVHAAGTSPAPDIGVADMVRDNVVATERLLRHVIALEVESVIYLSSLSVHGQVAGSEVDENTAICNPNAYGLTKRLGEEMLAALAPSVRAVAIRLPGILGRGSVRNWLTGVLAAAQAGRDIPVYNCAAPFNNAAHIDDLGALINQLIADDSWRGFGAFPIGAAGSMTVGDAVTVLIDGTGARARMLDEGARAPCYTISNRAALARGYRPQAIGDILHRFVLENRA